MTQPSLDARRTSPDHPTGGRGLAEDNRAFHSKLLATEMAQTAAQFDGRAETIADWQRDGSIFAVPHLGKDMFFTFQFRDGEPHPTIKKALAALPPHFSPWQRAAWFVSTNGWLDNEAPRDRLDEPELVVSAARREAEDVIG